MSSYVLLETLDGQYVFGNQRSLIGSPPIASLENVIQIYVTKDDRGLVVLAETLKFIGATATSAPHNIIKSSEYSALTLTGVRHVLGVDDDVVSGVDALTHYSQAAWSE